MDAALTRVGEAIAALGREDSGAARSAMAEAAVADRTLAPLADVMAFATAQLETDGAVSEAAWNSLADACPPELRELIDTWRP